MFVAGDAAGNTGGFYGKVDSETQRHHGFVHGSANSAVVYDRKAGTRAQNVYVS